MLQRAKEEEQVPQLRTDRSTTVHASAEGIATVTFQFKETGWRQGSQLAEMVTITRGGALKTIPIAQFYAIIESPEEELETWGESVYQEARRIGNMAAFGVATNFAELAEANINYSIRSKESHFETEKIAWGAIDENENITTVVATWGVTDEHGKIIGITEDIPKEPRGVHIFEGPDPDSLLEPLTLEEAEWFIDATIGNSPESSETIASKGNARQVLQPMLIDAVERAEDFLQAMDERNAHALRVGDDMISPWEVLGIGPAQFSRIRAGAKRWNIGGAWSDAATTVVTTPVFNDKPSGHPVKKGEAVAKGGGMTGIRVVRAANGGVLTRALYFIGEREGTVIGRESQNDIDFTKFDQHHRPGERIDGKLMINEELEAASREKWFDQMYISEVWDSEQKKMVPVQAPDGGPVNRSWSDRGLYLWRQSHSRGERFADKLWKVLTWPMVALKPAMSRLRTEYRKDIRCNAPGPGRVQVRGKWHNIPLQGLEGIEWLRSRGRGTMAGKSVSPEIRVYKGESWHKNQLNKQHLDILETAYLFRQGTIQLQADGDTIEEGVSTYEGLPIDYIINTYS